MSSSEPPAKLFPVSWDQFHRDARALAWRLASLGPFDGLVAVTRGGLVPAAIVARELGLRVVETVSVTTYSGNADGPEDERGQARVIKPLAASFLDARGARLLVVDDLVDTGATARVLRDLLPHAHLATVYAKPAGRPLVDTFVTEVSQDTWINFPWDLGLAFQPPIATGAA